jgi:hypothetical protein
MCTGTGPELDVHWLRVETIQMMTLTHFGLGRILLHLLAMAGDRCVRFHVAGIVRELAPRLAE